MVVRRETGRETTTAEIETETEKETEVGTGPGAERERENEDLAARLSLMEWRHLPCPPCPGTPQPCRSGTRIRTEDPVEVERGSESAPLVDEAADDEGAGAGAKREAAKAAKTGALPTARKKTK